MRWLVLLFIFAAKPTWSEDLVTPVMTDDAPAAGPHLPNIVHSTVVRWAAEPADRDAVCAEWVSAGASG